MSLTWCSNGETELSCLHVEDMRHAPLVARQVEEVSTGPWKPPLSASSSAAFLIPLSESPRFLVATVPEDDRMILMVPLPCSVDN